jgi:hypothetical protein
LSFFGGYSTGVTGAAFSPDGNFLALGSGNVVVLWDLARGREVRRFDFSHRPANVFAFSPDGKILAAGTWDGAVGLWEVATGNELAQGSGHRGSVTALAFSPDGKTLVSAGTETTVLFWDVSRLLAEGRRRPPPLSAEKLEALWKGLADADSMRADQAIWALVAAPKQAVPFLRARLRAVPAVDEWRIARLIKDLDSESFEERRQATEELEKLGDLAESALEKVLAGQVALEVRQRAEMLLEKLEKSVSSLEQLRQTRALEMLEHIGTAEARKVLEQLATGAPEARQTRDAQAALERLARRDDSAGTER